MSNSKVDICNLALSMIGERNIVSFSDNNNRARLCSTLYGQARDTVMSLFDWPFARAFEKLQQLTDVTLPEGRYAYKIPTGCTFPRALYPKKRNIEFEVLGDRVVCALPSEAYLYYSFIQDNPTKFSALFATSVADLLAAWLAHPLTGDKKMAELKMQMFNINLNTHTAVEANKGNDYRRADEDPNYDTFVNPQPILDEGYRGISD